jgi:hypothetical protein
MDRNVYVNVTTRLVIRCSEGEDIAQVLANMDYNFIASGFDNADIFETEILDWEIVDSRYD